VEKLWKVMGTFEITAFLPCFKGDACSNMPF